MAHQVSGHFESTSAQAPTPCHSTISSSGVRRRLYTEELPDLAQLRRENQRLLEDVEILKRATGFFATGVP